MTKSIKIFFKLTATFVRGRVDLYVCGRKVMPFWVIMPLMSQLTLIKKFFFYIEDFFQINEKVFQLKKLKKKTYSQKKKINIFNFNVFLFKRPLLRWFVLVFSV